MNLERAHTRRGRTRARQVTITDVARHAGVSVATVSRVLNHADNVRPQKRAAVCAAMETLGYTPDPFARGLAQGRSNLVGILAANVRDPYIAEALVGVEAGLQRTGLQPLIASVEGLSSPQAALRALMAAQIDALVLICETGLQGELADIKCHIPVVGIGPMLPGLPQSSLDIDNVAGARAAVRHLIELGHSRIAHLAGPLHHKHSQQRLEGYDLALQEAGIARPEAWVARGRFDHQAGTDAMNAVLDADQSLTAVLAANDRVAMGAVVALRARGLEVPRDVSVVGFDDLPVAAYLSPPLASVRQPVREMGTAVAAAVAQAIAGAQTHCPPLPIFTAELVIRGSTARPQRF